MSRDDVAEARATRLADGDRRLYESFRALGMSPAAALSAAAGRDGRLSSTDSIEQMTEAFEDLGLSKGAARVAAIGRGGTEYGMREAVRKDESPPDASGAVSNGTHLLDLIEAGHEVREAQDIIDRGVSSSARLTETPTQRRRSAGLAVRIRELENGPRRLSFLDALHEAEAELRSVQ